MPNTDNAGRDLRVLIVAEHASAKFGGEAILPLHYFRLLRKRGIPVWMIVHERTRAELMELLPDAKDEIHFIRDTGIHKALWNAGRPLPRKLHESTFGYLLRTYTQVQSRSLARELIAEHNINVVHQPIPVSPKEPSLLFDLGAPLVIGPMNGGMHYPPAFKHFENRATNAFVGAGRLASHAMNKAIPGKLRAETLVVANPRTRDALPRDVEGRVVELVENGVDVSMWQAQQRTQGTSTTARFAFVGRLVHLKALEIVIEAIARLHNEGLDVHLDVIGDGDMRTEWEALATSSGVQERVHFKGWIPMPQVAGELRAASALVLPSVHECGGAVVLEAMCLGLPVVATDWGGPADYLDDSCGILVPPTTRDALVSGFADAMRELATNPTLRKTLGDQGLRRIHEHYDWERKLDRMLEIYRETIERSNTH